MGLLASTAHQLINKTVTAQPPCWLPYDSICCSFARAGQFRSVTIVSIGISYWLLKQKSCEPPSKPPRSKQLIWLEHYGLQCELKCFSVNMASPFIHYLIWREITKRVTAFEGKARSCFQNLSQPHCHLEIECVAMRGEGLKIHM